MAKLWNRKLLAPGLALFVAVVLIAGSVVLLCLPSEHGDSRVTLDNFELIFGSQMSVEEVEGILGPSVEAPDASARALARAISPNEPGIISRFYVGKRDLINRRPVVIINFVEGRMTRGAVDVEYDPPHMQRLLEFIHNILVRPIRSAAGQGKMEKWEKWCQFIFPGAFSWAAGATQLTEK